MDRAGVRSDVPGWHRRRVLSPLSPTAEPAAWSVPAGRFPGLVFTGVTGTRP